MATPSVAATFASTYGRARFWASSASPVMTAARERFGEAHRREIVALCRARNLIVATHDDTETGHVDEAVREGAMISEFPTTLNAARRAHELGLKTILGSPNVVRGASHSGNVSARELAKEGLLDALSSD